MVVGKSSGADPAGRSSDRIVVVGAGPVGLTASLLLSKYRMPHLLVEQQTGPDDHPQAHFINYRSMEVLRELDHLDRAVSAQIAPTAQWRRFVYSTNLADLPAVVPGKTDPSNALLGVVDHFEDPPAADLSPAQVVHFPQHDFVRLLRARARKNETCRFLQGRLVDVREHPGNVAITLTDRRTGRRRQVQAPYLVGADGAHSTIRKQLGIDLISPGGTLQHLINVHFFSPRLAERLQTSIPAMLYFVYSDAGVAVIVAHALSRGEFVAQIPYFPPYQQPAEFTKKRCEQLLQNIIGEPLPIHINSIRTWRMKIGQACRYRSEGGRCFLIGDAAHQMTPAGGFGMNTGIQDAHNLIWKIAAAIRCEPTESCQSAESLLSSYETERKPIAELNAALSLQNYQTTLRVPDAIGLHLHRAKQLDRWLDRLPAAAGLKRAVFRIAMQLGLKQVNWLSSDHILFRRRRRALRGIFGDAKRHTLQLLFPGQDVGFVYRKGLLVDGEKPAAHPLDPFEYKPTLTVGARMPHFWLKGKDNRQISVLDLPSRMVGRNGSPRYIMLAAGDVQAEVKRFDETVAGAFHPRVTVQIGLQPASGDEADVWLQGEKPSFLPSHFAILMRPDGHIAWLHIPPAANAAVIGRRS